MKNILLKGYDNKGIALENMEILWPEEHTLDDLVRLYRTLCPSSVRIVCDIALQGMDS